MGVIEAGTLKKVFQEAKVGGKLLSLNSFSNAIRTLAVDSLGVWFYRPIRYEQKHPHGDENSGQEVAILIGKSRSPLTSENINDPRRTRIVSPPMTRACP